MAVSMSCPSGWIGRYPNCSPRPSGGVAPSGKVLAPGSGAIGGGTRTCPDGSYPTPTRPCPPAPAAAAGGGLGVSGTLPNMPAGAQSTWKPSDLARPDLTPIDPQAAYDPEIANQLARTRSYTEDLKAGTGFAEDVAVGAERDQLQAQMMEAEQAAAQAGIPFDKARFLMEAQRGQAGRRAQSTLNREQQVGASIGAESGVATAQAGERTQRLGLDLNRDVAENELALDRYGKDIQKYGIDAQAATAANSALMDFYTRLTSGIFSVASGGFGASNNFSSNYSYS